MSLLMRLIMRWEKWARKVQLNAIATGKRHNLHWFRQNNNNHPFRKTKPKRMNECISMQFYIFISVFFCVSFIFFFLFFCFGQTYIINFRLCTDWLNWMDIIDEQNIQKTKKYIISFWNLEFLSIWLCIFIFVFFFIFLISYHALTISLSHSFYRVSYECVWFCGWPIAF